MIRSQEIVLGVDSSTQSTKVVAVDLDTGAVVSEGRATHTGADTQDPTDWWSALETAVRVAVTDEMTVRGIAVAGQQHGFVTLDAEGRSGPTGSALEQRLLRAGCRTTERAGGFRGGGRVSPRGLIHDHQARPSGPHLAGGACPGPRDLPAARLPELSLDRDTGDRPQRGVGKRLVVAGY